MKRFAPLFLILFAAPAWGQGTPPADQITIIGGDPKIVEVDKIIVVKEKVTVYTKFPLTLQAPKGNISYAWDYPPGLTAKAKGSSLVIGSADKGTYTVSVLYYVFNKTTSAFDEKSVDTTFAIGEPGPGPIPPIPPGPDPLQGPLKAAYDADLSPTKAADFNNLIMLYQQGAVAANTATTIGQLFTAMQASAKTLGVAGKIPGVQQVLAAELTKTLGNPVMNPMVPLDKAAAVALFNRLVGVMQANKKTQKEKQ